MRMHIELDDDLVAEVDGLAGPRGRSNFVRVAIERAVKAERQRQALESAAGALSDSEHEWDQDVGSWVREQRRRDSRRVG